MDMEDSECFICQNSTRSIIDEESNWRSRRKKASRLENQLDVIFILRNLLKVPRILLVHQFREFDSNPEDWISLCDQCIELTDKARELHHKIKRIEEQLQKIEKDVLKKVKLSLIHDDNDEEAYHGNSAELRRKIRSFLKKQEVEVNYDDHDPDEFLKGDTLANYLASQHNSRTAQFLMVEKAEDVEMEEEIQSEVETTPPSPSSSTAISIADDEDPADLSSSEDDNDEDDDDEEEEEYAVKITGNFTRKIGKPEVDPLPSRSSSPIPPPPPAEENEIVTLSSSDDADSIKITGEVKPKMGTGRRSNDPFTCPHCRIQFNCQKSVQDHLRKLHPNTVSYKCPLCEKKFGGNHGKNLHMLTSHKDDPVTLKLQEETGIALNKCPLGCRHFYLTTSDLDKHLNRKHPGVDKNKIGEGKSRITKDGKLECGICGKIYEMAKLWSDHQWKQHDAENVTCPVEDCGGVFPGKGGDEFAIHFKRVHKRNKSKDKMEVPVNCEICGVEKSSKDNLYDHRRRVHKVGAKGRQLGNKKLQVLVNGKSVEVEVVDKVKEPLICTLCGKKFSSKSSLNSHVSFVHEKQFSLTCHVCGEGVRNRMRLNYHLLTKHEEDLVSKQLEEEEGLKLSRCEEVGCSARFLRKELLDKHVEEVHKGDGDEKKLKCKYCGKGFWMGQRLIRHEETHEGKGRADFKCELCGKGFGTKHYLRYHLLMTHKQAKKFRRM